MGLELLPQDPAAWPTLPGWSDWQWQLRHAIRSPQEVARLMPALTEGERSGLALSPELFRLGVTPYYFHLIDRDHPSCPVRMQVLPTGHEAVFSPGEYEDPLGEDALSPAPGLVHRYPDRVLLWATLRCAVYCRHCNRRRVVGGEEEPSLQALEPALAYIASHTEIRDVLISGGDPLCLSTARLDALLTRLRAIPHVEILRLGTRIPVCLPMRIDRELIAMLAKHHPLYINTHFNHGKELTAAAAAACERLADGGIPVANQTVLLRGINSSTKTLADLFRKLLRHRVRPYYLFQADPVHGTDHFRTPTAKAIEIMENLRGHVSGMAIPHLVIDAPEGGGKLPFGPTYLISATPEKVIVRNYKNRIFEYAEPIERDCTVPYDAVYFR